jgi:hypothetical protein
MRFSLAYSTQITIKPTGDFYARVSTLTVESSSLDDPNQAEVTCLFCGESGNIADVCKTSYTCDMCRATLDEGFINYCSSHNIHLCAKHLESKMQSDMCLWCSRKEMCRTYNQYHGNEMEESSQILEPLVMHRFEDLAEILEEEDNE